MDKSIVVVGGDPFYRKSVKSDLVASASKSSVRISLSSPSTEEMARECLSNSLFGSFKIVTIDGFVYKKDMDDFFTRFLTLDNSNILVIIDEPDCAKAIALEKKISTLGFRDKIDFRYLSDDMKPKERVRFIQNHASEEGLALSSEAAETLLDLCGSNLSVAHEEIMKLKLVTDSEITKKHVLYYVSSVGDYKDSIQFYISLMAGNGAQSLSIARRISFDEGAEVILGCLVRLSYLVLLLNCVNGNDKALMDFLKKKRSSLDIKWTLNSEEYSISKINDIPSQFVMRVAKKLYDRVDGRSFWSKLFAQCYENYLEYRVTANDNIASADMEKIICIISRS